MLTVAERKKIEIVAYKINHLQATYEEIAAHFGCGITTVNKSIAWGERRGMFLLDAQEKISAYITDVQKHIKWLESEIKYYKKRRYRVVEKGQEEGVNDDKSSKKESKKTKFYPGLIAQLSKELRETRHQLLELEGLLQHTITIKHLHEGKIEHTGDIKLHPAIESQLNKILGPQLIPAESVHGTS